MADGVTTFAGRYGAGELGSVLAHQDGGRWHRSVHRTRGDQTPGAACVRAGEVGPWCLTCAEGILRGSVKDGVALQSVLDLLGLLVELDEVSGPDVEETCTLLYDMEAARVELEGFTLYTSEGQAQLEADLEALEVHRRRLQDGLKTPAATEWLSETSFELVGEPATDETVLVGTTRPVWHNRTPEVQVLRAQNLRDDNILVVVVPRHVATRLREGPTSSGAGPVQSVPLLGTESTETLETAARLYTPGESETRPTRTLTGALQAARALAELQARRGRGDEETRS